MGILEWDGRQIFNTSEFVSPHLPGSGDLPFEGDEVGTDVLRWSSDFPETHSFYRVFSYYHDLYLQKRANGQPKNEALLDIIWKEKLTLGYEDLYPSGQFMRAFAAPYAYPFSLSSGIANNVYTNLPDIWDTGNKQNSISALRTTRRLNMGNSVIGPTDSYHLDFLSDEFKNHRGLDAISDGIIKSAVDQGKVYLDGMYNAPASNVYHPVFPSMYADSDEVSFISLADAAPTGTDGVEYFASRGAIFDDAFDYVTNAYTSGNSTRKVIDGVVTVGTTRSMQIYNRNLVEGVIFYETVTSAGRNLGTASAQAMPCLSGINDRKIAVPAMTKDVTLTLNNLSRRSGDWYTDVGFASGIEIGPSIDFVVEHNSNLSIAQNMFVKARTYEATYSGDFICTVPQTDFILGMVRYGMTTPSGVDIRYNFQATPKMVNVHVVSPFGDNQTINVGNYYPRYCVRVIRDGIRRFDTGTPQRFWDNLPESGATVDTTSNARKIYGPQVPILGSGLNATNQLPQTIGFLPASGLISVPAMQALIRRPEVRDYYTGPIQTITENDIVHMTENAVVSENSDCQHAVMVKADWVYHPNLQKQYTLAYPASGTISIEPLTIDSAYLNIGGVDIPLTTVGDVIPVPAEYYNSNPYDLYNRTVFLPHVPKLWVIDRLNFVVDSASSAYGARFTVKNRNNDLLVDMTTVATTTTQQLRLEGVAGDPNEVVNSWLCYRQPLTVTIQKNFGSSVNLTNMRLEVYVVEPPSTTEVSFHDENISKIVIPLDTPNATISTTLSSFTCSNIPAVPGQWWAANS